MADAAAIKQVAERVITDELGRDAEVVSVSVSEESDPEAGDILVVKVVYQADRDRLNAKVVAGMIRHLRAKLGDIDESRFPLLSFVARREAETEAA